MGNETLEYRDFGSSPDVMIARVAARQYGIVTLAQLRAAGLGKDAITRRVRSGRLHRVGQGLRAKVVTGMPL